MTVSDPWSARRVVGGVLAEEVVVMKGHARLEAIRRITPGPMQWEFAQPTLTLLWLHSGFSGARLRIGGKQVASSISARSNLGVVASEDQVSGEFDTDGHVAYALAFFDLQSLGLSRKLASTTFTFADARIAHGFAEIVAEARHPDPYFPLLFEGWTLKTIALLGSAGLEHGRSDRRDATKLTPPLTNRVREYVEHGLAGPLSVASLAAVAGYSERHFARAFRNAVGSSPYNYIVNRRIERAKSLIADGEKTMTQIAEVTGFGQPQRLSTAFRKVVGLSPTEYARAIR